jgi:hypothetical protein
MPYWKGLMETRVHAKMHFQFSSRPVVTAGGMLKQWTWMFSRTRLEKVNHLFLMSEEVEDEGQLS